MNEETESMSHQKDQTLIFFITSIFIFFFVHPSTPFTADHHHCMNYTSLDHPIRCRSHGPEVRFPFRLKDHDRDLCGATPPGFNLSCSDDEIPETLLHLPFSQTPFFVKAINYSSQTIDLLDPYGCTPSLLLHLNLSNSPFLYSTTSTSDSSVSYEVTFLKCSSGQPSYENCDVYRVDCLGGDHDHGGSKKMEIFASYDAQEERSTLSTKLNILSSDCKKRTMLVAFEYSYSYIPLWDHPLSHCEKIKTATFVPTGGSLDPNDNDWSIRLSWEKPDCRDCEVQGKGCRFKNRTTLVTECFNLIHTPHEALQGLKCILWQSFKDTRNYRLDTWVFFLCIIILSAMKLFYMYNLDEKNQLRIEKFLEDYKALNPTRYTYADLKRITNKFKVTLGEGAYGTVFKGRLSSEIEVAVKMLNNSQGNGEEFINEVSIISRIHHVNVVRLVGFCADGYRRALVYEFMLNESLEKYIFLKNNKGKSSSIFLGWQRLQDIAIGIAKGIEYLHQGCDHRILHFDIKPHNILLDRNFNPKISDFGLAKLCSKGESFVSMSAARGTIGYIAPEVLSRNFGNVSYKSDVYSFGMLLLEMVGGRKNTDATVSASQVYFPEWAYKRLEQGREMGFIKAEREGDEEIAKRLTIVALWCIQWYPIDRPSMKSAVQMLEGQVESLSVPPNPFTAAGHNQHASSSTNNNPKTIHPNYGLTAIPEQEECDN